MKILSPFLYFSREVCKSFFNFQIFWKRSPFLTDCTSNGDIFCSFLHIFRIPTQFFQVSTTSVGVIFHFFVNKSFWIWVGNKCDSRSLLFSAPLFYFVVVDEFRLGTKLGVETRKQALEKLEYFRETKKVEKNFGQFWKVRILPLKRVWFLGIPCCLRGVLIKNVIKLRISLGIF